MRELPILMNAQMVSPRWAVRKLQRLRHQPRSGPCHADRNGRADLKVSVAETNRRIPRDARQTVDRPCADPAHHTRHQHLISRYPDQAPTHRKFIDGAIRHA